MKESKESKKAAEKVKSKVEKVYLQMGVTGSSSLFVQLPAATTTSFKEVYGTITATRAAAQIAIKDGGKYEAPSTQFLDRIIVNGQRLNTLVSALMNQCLSTDWVI